MLYVGCRCYSVGGKAAEENEQQRVMEDDLLLLFTDSIPSEELDHLLVLPGGEWKINLQAASFATCG